MNFDNMLHSLISGIVEIYGDLVDRIVLYGSVARGTETRESDVDVAVLIKAGATKDMYERLLDLVVDLELENDKFQEWKDVMPFYRNIQNEGVLLWQAA